MALTLDAALQAAQDGASHHPIIEIKNSYSANLPLSGQYLTAETTDEQSPNTLTHSSGRICAIYTFGTSSFKFAYTNVERTEFSFTTLSAASIGVSGKSLLDASMCELADGTIGVIFVAYDGSNYYLRQAIIDELGAVQSTTLIATYAKASYSGCKSPFVVSLADASYYLVYILDPTSNTSAIYKRTSADFSSWSAEATVSPLGISTNFKTTASLLQISTGDIFLWLDYFDGANYANVYYSISSDNGATWGAAVAVTSYTDVVAYALHPVAVQKQANQMHLICNERRGALHANGDTDGWPDVNYDRISNIVVDSVGRKIYAINMSSVLGALQAVVEINIDTWSVVRYWNDVTSPGFGSEFFENSVYLPRDHGDRHLVPVGIQNAGNHVHVALLNADQNKITQYNFHDWESYGISKNVDYTIAGGGTLYYGYSWADYNSNRLYLLNYRTDGVLNIGYLDLTEEIADGELYTFTPIVNTTLSATEIQGIPNGCFVVLPDQDLIIVSTYNEVSSWKGRLIVFTLSTGAILKNYYVDTYSDFHYRGLRSCIYCDGKIFGCFGYWDDYGQADRRGILGVDLSADAITYYRPTWDTLDDYGLGEMALTDDNKIIISGTYGISIFDPSSGSWELINNTSVPGLTPNGNNSFFPVAYDDTACIIFAGTGVSEWMGVIAVSRYGDLKRANYMVGDYGASWVFGDDAPLVSGQNDYDAVPTLDPDGAMYVFWTKSVGHDELSLTWGLEAAEFDITPYLAANTEIILNRAIEGKPAQLVFAVTSGHLFDPHNLYSILRPYLMKGQVLTLRIGESVSGSSYWASQGSYYVTRVSLTYSRGQYPVMQVTCEDIRSIFDNLRMASTAYYGGNYPDILLSSLLTSKAAFDAGDMDFSEFDNQALLYHQWVDTDLHTACKEVCQRFGYFFRIDMDGKASASKIADDNAVDHVYSDTDTMINFSPDDDYSDFTNRVVVVGEERDFQTVTYAEEIVATKNGTIGWWQGSEKIRIPFSEDYSRVCVNPRIEWLTRYTGLFRLDGIGHEVVEDPDGRYIDLYLHAPSMALRLGILSLLILANCAIPDEVQVGPTGTGFTIPTGKITMGGTLFAIADIFGSVTNWQCIVHAQPRGNVRRSVQATANDTDHQTQIGRVVEQKIEEPMCYSVGHCQQVANSELLVTRLQRKRVRFTKIAHLQDEEGDTIQIPHPYTGDTMTIYIAGLTRRFKIAEAGDKSSGYVLDDIEGWVISL